MDAQAARPYSRRTFLVDRAFQLKYTAIMVGVGATITLIFGMMMYQAHVDATQLMGLPDSAQQLIISRYDERLMYIVAGIAVAMSSALAIFGVLVTHRVAGPVYIIGRYVQTLGEGQFPVMRPLRRADELKSFFRLFQEAVDQIRSRESSDLAALDAALGQLEGFCARTPDAAGALGTALVNLKSVRDRKRAALNAANPTPAATAVVPAPAPAA
jgi:hypothetical protein